MSIKPHNSPEAMPANSGMLFGTRVTQKTGFRRTSDDATEITSRPTAFSDKHSLDDHEESADIPTGNQAPRIASVGEHAEHGSSMFTTIRQLWPYLRRQKRRLILTGGLTFGLTGVEVAAPVLVGVFIDALMSQLSGGIPISPQFTATVLGTLIGLAIARGWFVWQFRALSGQVGERLAAQLRDALWSQVQVLPLEYTRRRGAGQILLRFIGDTRAIQRLVINGIVRLSQDVLLVGGILTALFVINWRMALAVVAILPGFGLIFWRLNPLLQRASRATRRRRSRLSSYLNERIAGLSVVKAFVQQEVEADRVKELNRDVARRATRRANVDGELQGLTTITVGLAGVAVLAIAAVEVTASRLSAGYLVAFYALLGLLLPVLQRVVAANRFFQEGQISMQRLTETLALTSEAASASVLPALTVSQGEVTLRDVSYNTESGRRVLSQVNLSAKRGSLTVVVGVNGSGKSTLMELILRFRSPGSGDISIDGQAVADVSLESLRRQIGFAGSDAVVFNGSVRDNIIYGLSTEEGSDEIVARAVQLAGANAFVSSLPDGLKTRVGRGGSQISAGQRQLIALARVLATDPPVLLLDDALSCLDPETERIVMASLQTLAWKKTIIITKHQMPDGAAGEKIYQFQNGTITVIKPDHLILP